MVRCLGFVFGLMFCTFGAGDTAYADCALIDRLERLQIIQSRLARDPDTALFATDIRQLRGISYGISNRATLEAVDGNGFTGHGADFLRFLQNTQLLLQAASLDDPQSVRPHFTTAVRDNLASIRMHLSNLRCSTSQIAFDAAAAAERGSDGSTDAEDLAEVADTLAAIVDEVFRPRSLLIAIVLVALISTITPLIRQWLQLRRRRAKRHNTNYATHYHWNNRRINGVLVDINCHGTKLRHGADSPLSIGATVEIAIADGAVDGTVMWSNAHYSGVQFRKTISLADVKVVCTEIHQSKTQNGAPRDAASQT